MGEYRFEMAATKDVPTVEALVDELLDQMLDHPTLWVKVPWYLEDQLIYPPSRFTAQPSHRQLGGLPVEFELDFESHVWVRQLQPASES